MTYFQIFQKYLSAYSWNKIYELKKLREFSILFDTERTLGEDVLFNIAYYDTCNFIIYLECPLYLYHDDNSNSATNRYRHNLFELNLPLFRSRFPLILPSEIGDFCDMYLYNFLNWLESTLDRRNTMPFLQKIRYNQKIMQTEEFRFCVAHMTGKDDSPLFIRVVQTHNYYLYWLFQKATQIKARLFVK